MTGSPNISISNREVTTYTPADTREIQLRLLDWHRIYRKVRSISPPGSKKELIAGALFGVSASALLTVITFDDASRPNSAWIKPSLWATCASSLVIGCVLLRSLKEGSTDVAADRSEIMKDMQEIHLLYFPKGSLDEEA